MTIDELLALVSSGDCPDICVDSRLIKDGDIFVAIKGTVYDGHDFIDQAITSGARYVIAQNSEVSIEHRASSINVIIVEDSTEAAALLAQAKAGNPASQLVNLAVTGTNGKTTVAYLVRSCILAAGQKCGLIGTVEYDTGLAVCQSSLTTPDCLEIARIQQQMVEAGCKYMVIEASSHALSQNRLAGINFKAAAFTNLTGDHLDYHKTKEDYLDSKTKLFSALSPDAIAVLNKQSPEAEYIARKTKAKILWYAIDEPADINAHIESMDINGTVFVIEYRGKNHQLATPLLGQYNVSNHLAAAGLCLTAGFDLETIATGLSALKIIPGRLEKINYTGHGSRVTGHVLIDYAHTDDALKNVLAILKPLCKGNLIVVFGCGGDRDRTKRPRMAKVAEELADCVIITSDNPRTEKPEGIIDEIIAGFEKEPAIQNQKTEDRRQKTEIITQRNTQYAIRNTKIIEPDRRKAIELAIKIAAKDDIVLIAGKGHENYQIIGTQKFHFSDKEVATKCLDIRNSNLSQTK